jgi:hypothetical protein
MMMTKKTRRKIDAATKAKIALEALVFEKMPARARGTREKRGLVAGFGRFAGGTFRSFRGTRGPRLSRGMAFSKAVSTPEHRDEARRKNRRHSRFQDQ